MDKRGFTLIELLIVIAVIGILSAVAVTSYVGVTKKAARSEAYNTLESLRLLEEQFFAENAAYTASKGVCGPNNPPNVTLIQNAPDALPGFRPGTGLSYSYCIEQNINLAGAGLTPCFRASAFGNDGTRVELDVFRIDCTNSRNF